MPKYYEIQMQWETDVPDKRINEMLAATMYKQLEANKMIALGDFEYSNYTSIDYKNRRGCRVLAENYA